MYTQHRLSSYIGKGPEQIELGSIDYAVPVDQKLSIELHTLFIEPEFRGKKFSKKMLRHFLSKMKSEYPNIPSIKLENIIGTAQFPFNTSIKSTNIQAKIKNIYKDVGFVYEKKGSNDMIYYMKGSNSANKSAKHSANKSAKHSANKSAKHSANKSAKHSANHTSKHSANKLSNINPSPSKKRKPLKGR